MSRKAEHARRKLQLAEARKKLERNRNQTRTEAELKQMQANDAAAGDLEQIPEQVELKDLLAKLWEEEDLNRSVPSVSGNIRKDQHSAHFTAAMNTALPLASAVAFTPSAVIGPIEAPVYTAAFHSYLDPNAPSFVNSYDNYAGNLVSLVMQNTTLWDRCGEEHLVIRHQCTKIQLIATSIWRLYTHWER